MGAVTWGVAAGGGLVHAIVPCWGIVAEGPGMLAGRVGPLSGACVLVSGRFVPAAAAAAAALAAAAAAKPAPSPAVLTPDRCKGPSSLNRSGSGGRMWDVVRSGAVLCADAQALVCGTS